MDSIVMDSIKLHKRLLGEFEARSIGIIKDISEAVYKVFQNGGTVYLCGNGGSAADAQHIAGEFIWRLKKIRRALPAVALTTETSSLTSLGNDDSFENVFSRQVDALMGDKDMLWALSTSGSSKNVIKAAGLAKEKNALVISFTGAAGSKLEKISDITLTVDSGQTASVQEIHELAYHIICELVENRFIDKE